MARPARGREVLAGIPSRRRTQKLQALLQGPLGSPGQHLDLPPGGPAHGPDGNPPARARRLDRRARAPRIDVTAPARAPRRPPPGHSPCLSARVVRLACLSRSRPWPAPASPGATTPGRRIHALLRRRTRRVVAVGSDTRQIASSPGCEAAREMPVAARLHSHRVQRDLPAQLCERGSDTDYVRNRTYRRLEDGARSPILRRVGGPMWGAGAVVQGAFHRFGQATTATGMGLSGTGGPTGTLRDASVPAEPHPIATLIA